MNNTPFTLHAVQFLPPRRWTYHPGGLKATGGRDIYREGFPPLSEYDQDTLMW